MKNLPACRGVLPRGGMTPRSPIRSTIACHSTSTRRASLSASRNRRRSLRRAASCTATAPTPHMTSPSSTQPSRVSRPELHHADRRPVSADVEAPASCEPGSLAPPSRRLLGRAEAVEVLVEPDPGLVWGVDSSASGGACPLLEGGGGAERRQPTPSAE